MLDIITIIAILLSPLVAIQVSKRLEKRKEKIKRRLDVFMTLMSTRGSVLSYDHVNALNRIDVEFYGKDKKLKDVVEAWKVYLDNLCDSNLKQKAFDSWISKNNELLIELLQKMAICLDYEFDKVSIKKTSYYPEKHGIEEAENFLIRNGLVNLLTGKNSIRVEIVSKDTEEEKKKMLELTKDYLSKDKPIKVILVKEKDNDSIF
jgi:hypothetical protein